MVFVMILFHMEGLAGYFVANILLEEQIYDTFLK